MDVRANTPIGSVSLKAVVHRADGSFEDLGEIAYWHKQWHKRFIWNLKKRLGR